MVKGPSFSEDLRRPRFWHPCLKTATEERKDKDHPFPGCKVTLAMGFGFDPPRGLTHQGFRPLARRHPPLALKMTPVRARGCRPAPQPLRGPRPAVPGRPCALAHPPAQRLQASLKFHCLALQLQETWENQLQLVSHHFPIDAVKEPHPSSLPWGCS